MLRKYNGLLIVVLWQVAPNPVAVDAAGRIQGVLGFGAGRYEQIATNCAGDVVSTSLLEYTGIGAQVDAWPGDNVRFTGFTGSMNSDDPDWDGIYYGAQAAFEGQRFGIGAGTLIGLGESLLPTGFIRAGSRDRVHVRFDVMPPAAPIGMAGTARFGIGYNQGLLRGPGLIGGLSMCHGPCNSGKESIGLFLDGRVPITRRWDLDVRGLLAPGEDYTNSGLAVAARFHLRQ